MTVRDVRLHWPRAEEAIASGEDVVVTRRGRPVARLSPWVERAVRRKRFDPQAHMARLARIWKGSRVCPSTDEWLALDRADDEAPR